jgi:hypothetical protein
MRRPSFNSPSRSLSHHLFIPHVIIFFHVVPYDYSERHGAIISAAPPWAIPNIPPSFGGAIGPSGIDMTMTEEIQRTDDVLYSYEGIEHSKM